MNLAFGRPILPLLLALAAVVGLASGGCRRWRDHTFGVDPGTTGDARIVVPSVTFTAVKTILQNACAQACHNARGATSDDIDLRDDGDLWGRLLAVAPPTVPTPCQNRPLVVPGDPEKSLLVVVIEAPDEPRAECAERMPHSCPEKRPCLTAAQIQAVRTWIQAGAPR